jgi:hypothetical protein
MLVPTPCHCLFPGEHSLYINMSIRFRNAKVLINAYILERLLKKH